VTDSLEKLNKKPDRYCMVFILRRSLHSNSDYVHDQILPSDQVTSMDGLITRLIRAPNLMKDDNQTRVIETSAMYLNLKNQNLIIFFIKSTKNF